jgi:Pentapeptide repeats (8 copies)
MRVFSPSPRPEPWASRRKRITQSWTLPFVKLERGLSILFAVLFYFSESGDRLKQKHYQAWQVINTAQGKGGSGGRIEALQELNADRIPLVGVDVSGAFLQGINLAKARLLRANFDSADLRDSDFHLADFTDADLKSANFRGSNLSKANFLRADLSGSDLGDADLAEANLAGANLDDADLGGANLAGLQWREIASAKNATIEGVRNAPLGFVDWAKQKGALTPLKAGEKSK